ncbi:glycerol-3-phosphate dehydrogenase/oxidase [Marinicrinis sediminis]|uniref:Glycerol-3-phosphate dehydrogenase n=1 Tax=Marinicrinis sediminis TaxID=1652465 RepID=A0ABW5R7A4_9BACL
MNQTAATTAEVGALAFSASSRAEHIERMKANKLDVLVIGGGITGAGIALDGVTRGLSVGLIEMQDFAEGTSSRSTKLIHGGLRYLKQFEVKMVAEVGKERAVVYENAPHVTIPEWMLLPIYKGGTFGKFSTSVGLRFYDYLAGVKKEERRSMLSAAQVKERCSLLKDEDLLGGGYYVEYRTDDARLTIEVMKKAVENGAYASNHLKAKELIYEGDRLIGIQAEDQLTGESHDIYAHRIVNAAGPWVDTLREKDGSKKGKTLRLTKGVHIVVDQVKFPLQQAVYFDTSDGRMVFAIPRDGKTYIGTTDTNYKGDIAKPVMTEADRDYLLQCIADMFPSVQLKPEDVESSWAGLRPLIHQEGKDPSEISRRDEIFVSDSGLISIAGGKLTGYRKMAEQVVTLVQKLLTESTGHRWSGKSLHDLPACRTKNMALSGGEVGGSQGFPRFIREKTERVKSLGLSEEVAKRWVMRYGSNIEDVLARYKQLAKQEQAVLLTELAYSFEHEMVMRPMDFLCRRTGALFFEMDAVQRNKERVVAEFQQQFGWTDEQARQAQQTVEEQIQEARSGQ